MVAQKLTPLQLELLKVYSFNPSNEELLEVKDILANYFSKRMINQIELSVEKNNITEEDLNKWLNSDD